MRFPRGKAQGVALPEHVEPIDECARVVHGVAEGPVDVSFLAVGRMVHSAVEAAQELEERGISARVFDMRWVKPVDARAVQAAAHDSRLLVSVEDGTLAGGFGSAVLETLADAGLEAQVLRLGLPDAFVGHGTVEGLLSMLELDAHGIAESVAHKLEGVAPARGGER